MGKIKQFFQSMNEMIAGCSDGDISSVNDNIENNNNNDANRQINENQIIRKQFGFVTLLAKLFTLVATCLSMTIITIILLMLDVKIGTHYSIVISIFGGSFDIMINSICLVLHWPFAQKWYKKMCMKCCYGKSVLFFMKVLNMSSLNSMMQSDTATGV